MTRPATFGSALLSSWALLLGFGILMLGDGLQTTLLAVRADQEGFSTTITGLIMSSFYVGFLLGSITTPKFTANVGHIRVFAALAALASASILIHAVFVQVPIWIALRFISGFCFAGLYIVAESWLNDRATNETRGKLLSLYMVVSYLGVGVGQLLLNLAEPGEYLLFILTSVLISVAVVPLLLSAGSPPAFRESVKISLGELFRLSPLGLVSIFMVGLVTATFFALGPVYGQRIGLDVKNISYFMAAAVLGTVILQGPLGALSDRFDRRIVLTIVSLLAALAAVICIPLSKNTTLTLLLSVGLFGGLAFPLYSICIAHTNDHLDPSQMIAASGALVLVSGLGAVLGPILIASIMDRFGVQYFFWSMAIALGLLGIFALYRMVIRPPVPLDKQGPITSTAAHPTSSGIEGIQQRARDEAIDDGSEN
ncbi:MAG: MFS transporter [Gammaproteobacteria bacterium]|nr:MFS transporter [Gammaproteobacteria bacterium]